MIMIIMNMLMMMIKRALRSRPVCAVDKANEETHTLMNAIEVSKMVFGNSLNCLQHFCFGPLQNRPKNERPAPPRIWEFGGGLAVRFSHGLVCCLRLARAVALRAPFGCFLACLFGAFWASRRRPRALLGLPWASRVLRGAPGIPFLLRQI